MKYLTLGLLVTLVSSCGYEKSLDVDATFEIDKEVSFNQILEKSSLSEDTPDGLGLLIGYSPSYQSTTINTCNWHTISPTIVMTNGHCIPSAAWANCAEHLGGIIRENGRTVIRKCKSVLKVQFEEWDDNYAFSANSPDYAFIELDIPVNSVLSTSVDRSGFKDREKLTLLILDSYTNSSTFEIEGKFRKTTCTAVQESNLGVFFHPLSSVITVFSNSYAPEKDDCYGIKGNSGSPVVDEKNKVLRGVYYAGPEAYDTNYYKEKKTYPWSYVTSSSCLVFPDGSLSNKNINAHCPKKIDFNQIKFERQKFNEYRDRKFENQVRQIISEKYGTKDLPQLFQKYDLYFQESEISPVYLVQPVPVCFDQSTVDVLKTTDQVDLVFDPEGFLVSYEMSLDQYNIISKTYTFEKRLLNRYEIKYFSVSENILFTNYEDTLSDVVISRCASETSESANL